MRYAVKRHLLKWTSIEINPTKRERNKARDGCFIPDKGLHVQNYTGARVHTHTHQRNVNDVLIQIKEDQIN